MYKRAWSAGAGRLLDLQQSMIFEHEDIVQKARL